MVQPKFDILTMNQPERIKRANATIRARFLKDTDFAHYHVNVVSYKKGDEAYLTKEEFSGLKESGRVEEVKNGQVPKGTPSSAVPKPVEMVDKDEDEDEDEEEKDK